MCWLLLTANCWCYVCSFFIPVCDDLILCVLFWMTRTLLLLLQSQLICHSQACESFSQITMEMKMKMKTPAITKQTTLVHEQHQIKLKLRIKHIMPMIMATSSSSGNHHYNHDQNYVYAKHSQSMVASIEQFCHWIDQSWDEVNLLLAVGLCAFENSQGEMRFTYFVHMLTDFSLSMRTFDIHLRQ